MPETIVISIVVGLQVAGLVFVTELLRNRAYSSWDKRLIWISVILLPLLGPILCAKKFKPLLVLEDFTNSGKSRSNSKSLAPVHPNLKLFHTTRHAASRLKSNRDLSELSVKRGVSLRPAWLERFDWVLHYDLDWVLKFGPNFIENRYKHQMKLTKLRNPPRTICVHNSKGLGIFAKEVLAQISNRIILYVGGGDEVPITDVYPKDLIDSLLENRKIAKIFIENKSIKSDKLIAMPIGLSPPDIIRSGPRLLEIQSTINLNEKVPKVLAGFWQPLPQRRKAEEFATANPGLCHYRKDKTTPEEYWELLSKYRFALSPPGKGMDCYRTYQILAVKTIPIVESCNRIYSEVFAGLPVVEIDDYAQISKENLDRWWSELSPLLNRAEHFVQSDYWWNKIAAAVSSEL